MTAESVEGELSPGPLPEAAKLLLGRFDSLTNGGSFVIASRTDPRWLLHLLQRRRPEMFDWSVLEHSSHRFRVQVSRRTSMIPRSVGEYLHRDHHRLDAMLGEVERFAFQGFFKKADERFEELPCGVERHITIEGGIVS